MTKKKTKQLVIISLKDKTCAIVDSEAKTKENRWQVISIFALILKNSSQLDQWKEGL